MTLKTLVIVPRIAAAQMNHCVAMEFVVILKMPATAHRIAQRTNRYAETECVETLRIPVIVRRIVEQGICAVTGSANRIWKPRAIARKIAGVSDVQAGASGREQEANDDVSGRWREFFRIGIVRAVWIGNPCSVDLADELVPVI